VPNHLTDAIANATGASGPGDLIALTEGDPVLGPIARAIADACDRISASDESLAALAAQVRAVELDFSAQRDGAGDKTTLHALSGASLALHEITGFYAARMEVGKHLDVLLELFTAADQRRTNT
jgi:hypothetical protein